MSPTTTELRSASIMRSFASSDLYQRSEGPSNGGTGTSPSWNENSISVITEEDERVDEREVRDASDRSEPSQRVTSLNRRADRR